MLYKHTDICQVIIYNQNNNKQTVTYTLEQYKTGLSSFNDKIWMRKDDEKEEWDTHSFGHYNLS